MGADPGRRIRHSETLLQVWLRAEDIRHLLVLRGHLLTPDTVSRLAALAAAAGVLAWPVWHRPGLPATAGTVGISLP